MVGFRVLPNTEVKAIVGNTPIGALRTLENDLKHCPGKPVLMSLGSNVLFNNFEVETERVRKIVERVTKDRELIIFPVPAKGKFKEKADKWNKWFKTLRNVRIIPLKQEVRDRLFKDNIHLKRSAYRIWKKQLENK
jgi:hypothetical protein